MKESPSSDLFETAQAALNMRLTIMPQQNPQTERFWGTAFRAILGFKNIAPLLSQRPNNSDLLHALQQWRDLTRNYPTDNLKQFYLVSLEAHANLGAQPDAQWFSNWCAASAPHLSSFGNNDLKKMAHSLVVLGLAPDKEWLGQWASNGKDNADLTAREMATRIYYLGALAVAGADREWCKNQTELLIARLGDYSEPEEMLSHHQIYLGCKALELPMPNWLNIGNLSSYCRNRHALDKFSMSERVIGAALKEAGFNLEPNRFNETSLSQMDHVASCLMDGEKHVFYVQFDGPQHFVIRPDGSLCPNGSTQLQSAIIERGLEPNEHLVRISYRETQQAQDLALLVREKAMASVMRVPVKQGIYLGRATAAAIAEKPICLGK